MHLEKIVHAFGRLSGRAPGPWSSWVCHNNGCTEWDLTLQRARHGLRIELRKQQIPGPSSQTMNAAPRRKHAASKEGYLPSSEACSNDSNGIEDAHMLKGWDEGEDEQASPKDELKSPASIMPFVTQHSMTTCCLHAALPDRMHRCAQSMVLNEAAVNRHA